jgi:hypothetical protein
MNKIISSIVICILVLAGIVWFARPSGQGESAAVSAAQSDGALVVEESRNYNFGTISMAAGNVSHTFKMRNAGGEPVTISKMYTSCMCTVASLMMGNKKFGPVGMPGHGAIPRINQTINPNEEAVVEVVFDPAAHGPAGVGRIGRTVVIENNSGAPVELSFIALVTP